MEWCDKRIKLLINFSLQNTFLFGVTLSDYHNQMNKCVLVVCHYYFWCHKWAAIFFVPDAIGTKTGAGIQHRIHSFWSMCRGLKSRVH